MCARQLKMLFDGTCPLCRREVRMLRHLDRGRMRLTFEDISAANFDPSRYSVSKDALMAEIHGVLPDGTLVRGMEVFRRAYAAVGMGWLLAPTAWPVLRPLCDRFYRIFAKNRLMLTGRGLHCGEACTRAA